MADLDEIHLQASKFSRVLIIEGFSSTFLNARRNIRLVFYFPGSLPLFRTRNEC